VTALEPLTERGGGAGSRGRQSRDRGDRVRRDRVLFQRYRDPHDPVDRDVVVERFLPLARRLAAGYANGSEPFDDLFQAACVGLVRAVDRFDLERHTAFSSYAVPTILGELRRHFRDRTWAIHVPRDLQDLGLKAERMAEELSARAGRPPTIRELARALDADEEAVLDALEALGAYRPTSLESTRAGDEGTEETLVESLGDHDAGFDRVDERGLIDQLLRCLPPREREVLRLRFEEDLTQREIGHRVGVSQMQVSRMLRDSVTRVRVIHGDRVQPET
jgi:RNA polymerase sigma-B factor